MKGKVVAIIGAGGGIGKKTCRLLSDAGATVAAGVRDLSKAEGFNELSGVETLQIDAEDWNSVEAFFDEVGERLGPIDGVALCVGSILLKPAHMTSKKAFDETISRNLSSAFAVVRSGCKRMMKTGGSIVLISTAAARHGFPNHEAIAAAKGGVMGLALSAAATYAGQGVRVNCVAPGLVDTPLAKSITGNEQAKKASQAMHAMGRLGEPGDVARAIVWLLDPDQSWLTGQTIGVDGGLASLYSKKG